MAEISTKIPGFEGVFERIEKEPRILAAYVLGSVAAGSMRPDIDIAVLPGGGADLSSLYIFDLSAELSMITEEAMKLLKRLPDEISWDDLMYEIYVRKKIASGLVAAEAGKLLPHDQIKRRFFGRENHVANSETGQGSLMSDRDDRPVETVQQWL